MKRYGALMAGLALAAALLVACGGDGGANQAASTVGPADPQASVNFDPAFFSAEITNRYFPWASVCRTVLEGEEVDGKRIKIREESVRGQPGHQYLGGAHHVYRGARLLRWETR